MVVVPSLMRMIGTGLWDDAEMDGWICVLLLKSSDWKGEIVSG